jgi:hypothetical protein
VTPVDIDEAAFLALVARINASAPVISSLAAGLLAAGHLGLVKDSRSFAQAFDVGHALALRALTELAGDGLVDIIRRDPRSQRATFALTALGRQRAEHRS